MTSALQHSLVRLENLQKLMELQWDLVGMDNLIAPGRVSAAGCVSCSLRCLGCDTITYHRIPPFRVCSSVFLVYLPGCATITTI